MRYLLKSEYSGKPERMSVMLWAEMDVASTTVVSVRKKRILCPMLESFRAWKESETVKWELKRVKKR